MTNREKLIELLKEAEQSCVFNKFQGQEINPYFYIADYLISKGVTIPVRCGECKHFKNGDYCTEDKMEHGHCREKDFCSYGERR